MTLKTKSLFIAENAGNGVFRAGNFCQKEWGLIRFLQKSWEHKQRFHRIKRESRRFFIAIMALNCSVSLALWILNSTISSKDFLLIVILCLSLIVFFAFRLNKFVINYILFFTGRECIASCPELIYRKRENRHYMSVVDWEYFSIKQLWFLRLYHVLCSRIGHLLYRSFDIRNKWWEGTATSLEILKKVLDASPHQDSLVRRASK